MKNEEEVEKKILIAKRLAVDSRVQSRAPLLSLILPQSFMISAFSCTVHLADDMQSQLVTVCLIEWKNGSETARKRKTLRD